VSPTSTRRPRRHRVVVVGAGLTGLAAAWHVRDDLDVTVFEASDRVGGEIHTIDLAGARFDVGADAFLARQPEAEQLARAAGFGDDDLVAPATSDVGLWIDGRRRPLPSGTVLGAPTDPVALARSGVLGPGAILRAALEPVLPRRRVVGDRSVADLVAERFGHQVVERLVEPLLGGVYAGRTDRLSAQVAAAPIWAAAQRGRSLLVGLARHRAGSADDDRPVFLTIRGGLGRLVERLADDLGDRVRPATPVVGLARTEAGGYEITVEDGSVVTADSVVLAVPAPVAAELLAPLCPEAAREFAGIPTASVGVVALAYPRPGGAAGPQGSGLLVPPTEGRVVKAVTFASNKWPHHADHEHLLLRASVGRVDDDRALQRSEEQLLASVDREVREMTGLHVPPVAHHVQRWPGGLPQHEVGHRARIDRIHHALRGDAPSLFVGGAALDGVGLAARARDAARLAHALRDAADRSDMA
jgi:protoporphyrinogen/coproporphyrinogen III oxidase